MAARILKLQYFRLSNRLFMVNDGTLNEFSNHTSTRIGFILLSPSPLCSYCCCFLSCFAFIFTRLSGRLRFNVFLLTVARVTLACKLQSMYVCCRVPKRVGYKIHGQCTTTERRSESKYKNRTIPHNNTTNRSGCCSAAVVVLLRPHREKSNILQRKNFQLCHTKNTENSSGDLKRIRLS